jgi:hypothetical protein
MSDAPKQIWALHYECEDDPDAIAIGYPEKFFGAHEYVRADRIEELEGKLAKAVEALDEAVYLLDPTEKDMTKKAGVYRIVTTLAELKGEDRG